MFREKLSKILFKKYKWNFFILFFFSFLTIFFSFLIRFNLRNNLTFNRNIRGKFDYLFGEFSVIKEVTKKGQIYVDWTKLTLILFLLYFPLKIIVRLASDYFQEIYERKLTVYLTKKMLSFAYKNKEWIVKKRNEKIYVITNVVPNFSWRFFDIPVRLFNIFTDISFDVFWFYFLVDSRQLSKILPFVFVFIIANLVWFVSYKLFTNKPRQAKEQKKIDYRQTEKGQIKVFLENLNISDNKPQSLEKTHNMLDSNSKKMFSLHFTSLVLSLPDLIIPGLAVFFLYVFYNFYLGGQGGLAWSDYFIAFNIQSLFLAVRRMFNLLPTISSLRKNYQQIESFFD